MERISRAEVRIQELGEMLDSNFYLPDLTEISRLKRISEVSRISLLDEVAIRSFAIQKYAQRIVCLETLLHLRLSNSYLFGLEVG